MHVISGPSKSRAPAFLALDVGTQARVTDRCILTTKDSQFWDCKPEPGGNGNTEMSLVPNRLGEGVLGWTFGRIKECSRIERKNGGRFGWMGEWAVLESRSIVS